MFAISHDHDISRFPIPAILDDCDDPLDCDGRIAIAILHAFSSSRLRAIFCAWIATSYARDDDIINRHTITTTAINPNICKALWLVLNELAALELFDSQYYCNIVHLLCSDLSPSIVERLRSCRAFLCAGRLCS